MTDTEPCPACGASWPASQWDGTTLTVPIPKVAPCACTAEQRYAAQSRKDAEWAARLMESWYPEKP